MRFHEYLQFAVFSQVIMKQQHKKLWIVPELNAMRVLSFGLVVRIFLFLKEKKQETCSDLKQKHYSIALGYFGAGC